MKYHKDSLLEPGILFIPAEAREAIAAGADVNARDNWGRTPLHLTPVPEVAIALLQAGADWTIKDSEGLTAAQYQRCGLRERVKAAEAIEQWVAAYGRSKSIHKRLEAFEEQPGPGL